MKEITESMKPRYYPNFIQQRSGNTVYFLTELISGGIYRRNVKLDGDYVNSIKHERDMFLADAAEAVEDALVNQINKYDEEYDGKTYVLDDLPEGIDILDVMGEARRGIWTQDGRLTPQEAEVAIFAAVERKRAKEK